MGGREPSSRVMRAMFDLMARQHGAASTGQLRRLGITRRIERRLIGDGTLSSPYPEVLTLRGAPATYQLRAMAGVLAPGVIAASHGCAARLHRLDGFDRYADIDVIAMRSSNPPVVPGAILHRTRGPLQEHITTVEGISVLSIGCTLALLAPTVGIGRTAKALDSALRLGVGSEELQAVARAWTKRGRAGPPALLMLLGERIDKRLPRSWFQRIAKRVVAIAGVRLVDEYPLRDQRGVLLAELDLADPVHKVGVECQSWRWHATPTAQHRDARRRGMLRQLGWEIVDVWWSDLRHPERVIAEITYLHRTRRAS